MSGNASAFGGAGDWGLHYSQVPDTTQREALGTIITVNSPTNGGRELIYGKATAAIRQFGLVTIGGAITAGVLETRFTEVPNTANQGRPVGVALSSMAANTFGWVVISGAVPVNATASIAADAVLGIGAVGQAGANSAGKQVLGAVGVAASSTTVVKKATGRAGATQIKVSDSAGWFPGLYLSGTGIAAGTVITGIDPSGTIITLSAATTAMISGDVTGTYNNGTVHYPTIYLNRPFLQGAIT